MKSYKNSVESKFSLLEIVVQIVKLIFVTYRRKYHIFITRTTRVPNWDVIQMKFNAFNFQVLSVDNNLSRSVWVVLLKALGGPHSILLIWRRIDKINRQRKVWYLNCTYSWNYKQAKMVLSLINFTYNQRKIGA